MLFVRAVSVGGLPADERLPRRVPLQHLVRTTNVKNCMFFEPNQVFSCGIGLVVKKLAKKFFLLLTKTPLYINLHS